MDLVVVLSGFNGCYWVFKDAFVGFLIAEVVLVDVIIF